MEVQEIPPEMVRHNSLSALGAFLPDRALANMDASRRAGHNSLSALGAFLPHAKEVADANACYSQVTIAFRR